MSNKDFILEMITSKKKLEDYPDRISQSLLLQEPSSLPFGGTYKGFDAYTQFYPLVRDFYDFRQLEVEDVYGDKNAVFVIINVKVKRSNEPLKLCERFLFDEEGRVIQIMVFLFDYENKPIHRILG